MWATPSLIKQQQQKKLVLFNFNFKLCTFMLTQFNFLVENNIEISNATSNKSAVASLKCGIFLKFPF